MVALELALDALERLTRVLAKQLEEPRSSVDDLLCLDLDVRRGAAPARLRRLVHHDSCVWQCGATTLLARGEKEASHARRHAHARGAHGRGQVLHRVVDREAGLDDAAR